MEKFVFDFKEQHFLNDVIDSEHKLEDSSPKNIRKRRITIDLHDCSLLEAKESLQALLQYCPRKKGISVLIITGKGLNSKNNNPVIRNFVMEFLQEKYIKWKLAPPHKGGEGALIATL